MSLRCESVCGRVVWDSAQERRRSLKGEISSPSTGKGMDEKERKLMGDLILYVVLKRLRNSFVISGHFFSRRIIVAAVKYTARAAGRISLQAMYNRRILFPFPSEGRRGRRRDMDEKVSMLK